MKIKNTQHAENMLILQEIRVYVAKPQSLSTKGNVYIFPPSVGPMRAWALWETDKQLCRQRSRQDPHSVWGRQTHRHPQSSEWGSRKSGQQPRQKAYLPQIHGEEVAAIGSHWGRGRGSVVWCVTDNRSMSPTLSAVTAGPCPAARVCSVCGSPGGLVWISGGSDVLVNYQLKKQVSRGSQ